MQIVAKHFYMTQTGNKQSKIPKFTKKLTLKDLKIIDTFFIDIEVVKKQTV